MSKLAELLDKQQHERRATYAVARGNAKALIQDMTPEQINECAIRFITYFLLFKTKE